MAAIQDKDFVEINYTGKLHENGEVFDTTEEKVAKDNDLYQEGQTYEPATICIGRGHLIKGLDEHLLGKDAGKSYSFTVEPEKAFGKKNPKLLKIMAMGPFRKQDIMPQPGLQVSIDGQVGMIRSVTGGRVVVDFNHPLSGKQLDYEVMVKRILTSNEEKAKALVKLLFNQEAGDVKATETSLKITLPMEIPDELKDLMSKEFKELIGIEPEFTVKEPEEPKASEEPENKEKTESEE